MFENAKAILAFTPLNEIASSVVELTRKCVSITALKRARQLHALVLTGGGTAESPYANNNLISMYARCGFLEQARNVFDKMPQRNVVSYNALYSAYSRSPDYASCAFSLITHMEFDSLRPNSSTFTSLVQVCAVAEDVLMGSSLHSQVIKLGFSDNVVVQTSVLGMYSSCGDLDSARRIFECVNDGDAVAWNAMIVGSLRNDKIEEGLMLFRSMLMSGVDPTQFTYSMVLNACSKLGSYSLGKVIHARIIVSDSLADLPVENALLDMYCSCGDMKEALYVFGRIRNPNLVSWNSIISGCSENGFGEEAILMYCRLQRRSTRRPDEYTFSAVISTTAEPERFIHGKLLHGQVMKLGYERSVFVGTTLLSMYFKNGEAESAQKVFGAITEKDIVLWTEMIVGQSRVGNSECAVQFFIEMYREKNRTDGFSLSSVLGACSDIAMLRQGEVFHSLSVKTGFDSVMSVCGALVDMYSKNGRYDTAESIFLLVSNPDLKCWNSMLGAYSQHGMVEEALNVFEQILANGLTPDAVTYLSLLVACSHSGSTRQGKFLWNQMKEKGIKAGFKHYSCMVSLVSKAGLLDEALELIEECLPENNQAELWRTLLSACVNTRNLQMGLYAAEQILRLDPEDTSTHILLSNLYAVYGRWEDVAEMRRKIRGLASTKDPGLSWIEVNNNSTQVFSSGDQSNPEVNQAQDELNRLKSNMLCKSSSNEQDPFFTRLVCSD
ncbi:LOW QUALITY PROTEIN: pentatricopeptide repeat-containing protein At3g50420 [Eutrema salsugineum]|uniref:LOW QUALITY PROTEIN: pentatricopeptide repeat-containing protein At3g50420 n=1 Tax=Eutrema salsugineum TaxID=72664 RepID=UPI000CED4982|nr:LOW QUALITY PROTEIN: pentatricopeptide repeat-containing protein At3g50420 [Eutrema salsugineum]